MHLNNLYTVQAVSEKENIIWAIIRLNEDHPVFQGHFPGQPVLPGVCMMEIITEITGETLNREFRISGGPMIKFLHMIVPEIHPVIELEIEFQPSGEKITARGKIFYESRVFMKYQLLLVPEMYG